jgi:glycosyltransferase involved in cell wall biosynthesis
VRFSVIVPAHNEAWWLPRALASITAAGARVEGPVEVVVVANRCTDDTALIAASADAVVIESLARNVAAVRNAGAGVATGETIVTIDADCVMAPTALCGVEDLLDSGKYVGGGTKVRPERSSVGIWATYA